MKQGQRTETRNTKRCSEKIQGLGAKRKTGKILALIQVKPGQKPHKIIPELGELWHLQLNVGGQRGESRAFFIKWQKRS